MQNFKNADGNHIFEKMVKEIQIKKGYLSDIDGLIGDGDHGMNMNKGFSVFKTRFGGKNCSFSEGLSKLGIILLNEIGGSMGPIYGTIFMAMAESLQENDLEEIDLESFAACLTAALKSIYEIVDARVGDKTLVDCLAPAVESLNKSVLDNVTFSEALMNMKYAAEKGRDSTKQLIAKYGRSSRLGERSRGVLDAGSCSCYIILSSIADGILELL